MYTQDRAIKTVNYETIKGMEFKFITLRSLKNNKTRTKVYAGKIALKGCNGSMRSAVDTALSYAKANTTDYPEHPRGQWVAVDRLEYNAMQYLHGKTTAGSIKASKLA